MLKMLPRHHKLDAMQCATNNQQPAALCTRSGACNVECLCAFIVWNIFGMLKGVYVASTHSSASIGGNAATSVPLLAKCYNIVDICVYVLFLLLSILQCMLNIILQIYFHLATHFMYFSFEWLAERSHDYLLRCFFQSFLFLLWTHI